MKHYGTPVIIIVAVVCITSVLLTLYPLISNRLAEKNQSLIQATYNEQVEETSDIDIEAIIAAAREYNAALLGDTFTQETLQAASKDYEALLSISPDGMMGYIEIPKIDVYLPIFHGTEADVLEIGAGHILGSSLPIGGESTHSVLSAHSGFANSKLFSDLDQMEVGDIFYLHILDRRLTYQVDAINTVLPDDTTLLGISDGEDYCTLVTCTPFGVNTHRLLVRGTRIAEISEEELVFETFNSVPTPSTWEREYEKGLIIGLTLVAVVLIVAIAKTPRKCGRHERP